MTLQLEDVDEQMDLQIPLVQWKRITVFYSHEPSNSSDQGPVSSEYELQIQDIQSHSM